MGTREKVFMVITALAASASVIYLQRRFDAADVRNGVEIARTYRAPSGRTLPDVLGARHPGASIDWRGTDESSCFQHVRVDAVVTGPGQTAADYEFSVDLNGPSIHPANPLGQEAVAGLDAKAAGSDSGR
jgi:hypothetical protein